jgi:AcrR family transcriptional regulator
VPADGRAARALRTREAIVDACIAMVEEGNLRPTAPRVAERAGVSVRSVFQHFDDLPALHTAVSERVADRMAVLVVPTDPDRPLAGRVETFVSHRAALLEAVTPFRRAARVHGPFSPQIREAIARGTAFLRGEVAASFAPELDRLAPEDRAGLLDALTVATSWGVWDELRAEGGATAEAARSTMARIVRALLADAVGR